MRSEFFQDKQITLILLAATRCYGLVELKLEVIHLLLSIYYISLQMFEHKTTDLRLV